MAHAEDPDTRLLRRFRNLDLDRHIADNRGAALNRARHHGEPDDRGAQEGKDQKQRVIFKDAQRMQLALRLLAVLCFFAPHHFFTVLLPEIKLSLRRTVEAFSSCGIR